MKALLHFTASDRLRKRLTALEGLNVAIVDGADMDGFAREIVDTDVLLHVLEPVTAEMISVAPRLKLIQKIGVGVNAIDRVAARRAGVAIANMPGTNTQAVAEHTLALMLATLRKVVAFDHATRRGEGWCLPPNSAEALGELGGSTVGFVGYGAVPQRLCPVLEALGARVQFWNRMPRPDASAKQVSLKTLLATSDIVSLHVPTASDTRNLLDDKALRSLKPGAILINTARGELVDQGALLACLREGQIAGAGIDVFEREPIADDDPLLDCATAVLSPHIAWLTPQTIERSLTVITENCRRLQNYEPLLHQVFD